MTTTVSTNTARPCNFGVRALASGVCAFAMSACSAIQAPSMPRLGAADVTPVLTEHSRGLQGLGALIEGSNMAPIVIGVGDIRDRTIPVRASLLVEDGVNYAEIGFDARWADGPQLAQRRIAEAATLIHVAHALKIDFRPCLESGWGDLEAFRESLAGYERMTRLDRDRALQADLVHVALDPGTVDGRWGAKSSNALQTWRTSRLRRSKPRCAARWSATRRPPLPPARPPRRFPTRREGLAERTQQRAFKQRPIQHPRRIGSALPLPPEAL